MNIDYCLPILREIIQHQTENNRDPMFLKDSDAIFGERWLKKVWSYLKRNCSLSLDHVQDLHIIKTKESGVLKKVSDAFISEVATNAMQVEVLKKFKIWIVDMDFHDHPLLAPGRGIVEESTDDGKRKLLQRCIQNGIIPFNNICSDAEREWFKEFLPVTLSKSLISALEQLKLFKCYSSVQISSQIGYKSMKECRYVYVGDKDFPIQFPKVLIMSSTRKEERLLSELSSEEVDLTICVKKSLEKITNGTISLSEENKRRFCFYVLEKQSMLRDWWKIQTDLNSVKFIRNGMGIHYSANELYDRKNDLLLKLFVTEHKFPEEDTEKMDLLKHLQFQNRNSPAFRNDVVKTCKLIDSGNIEQDIKLKKSKSLLLTFRQDQPLFQSICDSIGGCKILPFKQDRGEKYPPSMEWYSNQEKFVSLDVIYSSKFEYIAGSVIPTSTQEWEELVNTNKVPQLNAVIRHFCLATKCYREDEHAGYNYIMREVYQFLAYENWTRFASSVPQNCVLTDFGFMKASDIYIERSNADVDLAPYYIPLPKEYNSLKDFFTRLGCNKNQSCYLLVEALQKIKEKQLEAEDMNDDHQDLEKVEKILKKLSEFTEEELSALKKDILVPIHNQDSAILTFRFAHECAYSDSDWFSRTFTEEDNICLIHSRIDKEIAKKLGVKSLKKFTLSDAEEVFSEFGQSEPLTQRLNRLLEDGYTDGLSVPKELIQNADDAGASEVYFLYDERENKDARSCLIDPGMESCQGPAFWAFNNAVFSPSDFQNIQKLSGATKKEDSTKIGKFGLGFNAVYNLTDVPSFASGNHLVYLDPHGKYLGEAIIHERSPGIKLNLLNKTMLRKLENQFKPFQNVFGFKSSEFSEEKGYNGTLFRFPLRTRLQAIDSEISSKEYSQNEMEKLLKMFCMSVGNMLLFTQNVKKIKLFHVQERSTNPDEDMELVVTVEKEEKFENSVIYNNGNVLTAASRHCCSSNQPSRFSTMCKTKITIFSEGHPWVENSSSREESNWLISWALGTKRSFKLFKEKSSDGALPLSSAAIPVDVINGKFSPRFLRASSPAFNRYGFYETSHLFCFLPLPIKTSLAFHVNGTFAVSSDRQRILTRTEDDKENTKQVVWNNSLISDATLEALLELLNNLKMTTTEEKACYELWPTCSEEFFWETFHHEFYRCIVERKLPLFKTHLGYKEFQECIFLHTDVKADKQLHRVALDVLKKNQLDGMVITEIPDAVYNELENCLGTELLEHLVTYERFITESFLPSISLFTGEEYDQIVLGALRSRNDIILSALKETECITTSPNGTKKSPGNLVHPRSSVSGIFKTDNERFPTDLFCKEDDLEILVQIGMMKYNVPCELLLSQTRNVENLSKLCTECALRRSKDIVKYIYLKFQTFSEENLHKISFTSFLPVGRKPTNWPVKWHREAESQQCKFMKCESHEECTDSVTLFEKPINLYFPSVQKLVGCSQAVIGRYDMYRNYESVLESLGVKKEKDVDLETLKHQLFEITKNPEDAQNKDVEDICFEIYKTFEQHISEPEVADFIQTYLSDLPCIITEKKFVFPKQVVFSLMHDCSPHFYGLRPKYALRFPSLMETIGVRKSFESEDIVQVFIQMKELYTQKEMSKDDLSLVCRMAILLENCDDIPTENLYLPDSNGILCHTDDLCIDDFDWIAKSESMRFLNTAIPLKVAEMIGIKSKRDQSILNDSEELGDEFGQHEELTTRIRRILDGYPEACILKELLQNADDAGATELHFIKDFRSHGTKHIFSDNWKELQGPALCVYNDSVFTETDLQGIQNLGIGSKADDPTATGQYGVGFNVVYHLTDVPSFITRDLETGLDTLCVLDPHLTYIPKASRMKPGRKFRNATKRVFSKFSDIMSGYLDNSDIWKSSRGTLFRFPLRCNDESLLSQRKTTCKDLETLLDELKKEMAECLLFLNNVRKISISSVENDGSIRQEFIVKAEALIDLQEKDRLNQFVQEARHQMKKNSTFLCSMGRKEIMYRLKIDVDKQCTQEWLIVSGFGFKDEKTIPDRVKKAYEKRHLALLPCCGVACNLMNERIIQNPNGPKIVPMTFDHFKAYCFLPLPLTTGLPVHINGHFALDHEARRNIWWPDDASDLKLAWNKCLIENVIVPTYISILQYLKTALFPNINTRKPWRKLDQFHKAFPFNAKLKDKIWEYMTKVLYKQIAETDCPVFPIVRREYQMLKMEDVKEDVNKMQTDKEQESKKTEKPILQEELLEIRWVSLLSGSFPAYFDEIKYQLKNDFVKQNYDGYYGQSYMELMRWATKESEFLGGILKDLGMKLIESPIWMYVSMKNAGVNVHTVSPQAVLQFLKSYCFRDVDKCNVGKVNVHVTDTRFGSIDGVYCLLDYCLKDKNLDCAEFEQVPLLLTADEQIREFTTRNKVYLLSLPELLPASANKIVHLSQFNLLTNYNVFKKFVTHLQIEDFADLIFDNIPQRYISGLVQPWNQQEFDIPNMKWIKQFWCFLSENLGCLEHEQRLKEMKTETNEKKVDSPVVILCSSIRKYLAECCFLPAVVNDEKKLYPFKDGKRVLKIIPSVSGPEQTALTSLKIPVVDEECLPSDKDWFFSEYHTSEILKCLVTTVESVTDVLDCILFNKRCLQLDHNSSQCMLDFFAKRLKILKKADKSQIKLRSLPFYSGLDNNFITLPKGTTIVLPDDVPVEGLVAFGLQRNILFIRKNDTSLALLEYLGCIMTSKAALYIHYILPHLQIMPSTAIMNHLKYMKDIVLPEMNYYQDEDCERNLKLLKRLLQQLAFLPTESGNVARACEFFNPHKDIFKIENQLCRSSELPPAPFNGEEWEDFLVVCGMKSDITPKIFVDFANRLQKLSESGLLPVVIANSRRLMNILFHENPDLLKDYDLVSKVQEIKFLTPHSVQQIYLTIAPEYENGNKLVCFRNSTTPTNALLVWSVMGIISDDLINMMRKSDINTATGTLGLVELPPIHVVLDHTRVVCNVLKDQLEERIARNYDFEESLTTMMSRIYGYLQRNGNEESKDKLKSIPFIFIKDRKMLVLPEQVVLDISEHEEIPPYLCKASLFFGQYHTMFGVHGAAKSLTSSHLAKVLVKIWAKSKGNVLEPNERYDTEKAVQLLFSKLTFEKVVDLKVATLYLPSKKGNLVRSDSLVFVDHKCLEQRIGKDMPDLDFFIGFKELKIEAHDPVLEINRLPEKYRPHLLSKIVTEQLDTNCKDWAIPSDYGKQLQKFLHSSEFILGVCRLVRDEYYSNDKNFGEKEKLEIFQKLQSVVVVCVERLTTVMVYKNKALPDTSLQRELFSAQDLDEKDCEKLYIYFAIVRDTEITAWINRISKQLSSILNAYLGKPLKENNIHFPDVLKCIADPGTIEIELDQQQIRKIDVGLFSETLLFMPELGSEIPISLHHLLDNSCTYIESGKFVAYELFDPLIDEDNACDADPVYILAKVMQMTSDHSKSCPNVDEWNINYMINIGDGNVIEAAASKIYKFLRNDDTDGGVDVVDGAVVFRWKTDQIKSYIRDVLRNAFRRTKKEFKRAIKRLLLQYHPDLHQENQDYFNELTVFIFFIKKRLEEGLSVDDRDIFENFSSRTHSSTTEFENSCNRRAANYSRRKQEYESRGGGGGGGGSFFFRDFIGKGSQPGQARRWFRQAEFDLQASTSDQNQSNAHNWACYKSHQCAEKALKALLYQMDADQVDRIHNLTALIQGLDDFELSELAYQLEGITGSYFRMRYPDAVPGGHGMATPSEIYTSNQAEEAIELAGKILELVRRKIPNI